MALVRVTAMITGTWIVLGMIYFLLPGRGFTPWREVTRLITGLVVVGVVLFWQTRRVARAEMPELQAIQALGMVIPLFFLVFATLYLSLDHANPRAFSQPLDHTAALYLTITVFSTVGFGDITPVNNAARIAVSIQMLLDLVVLGFGVRAVFGVAKSSFESRSIEE
jgi:voltage-gated potassium channel